MSDKKPEYTATIQITQTKQDDGVDLIGCTLSFDPMSEDTDVGAYIVASELIRHYLETSGYIDEDGNLIDPDDITGANIEGPDTVQ